MSLDKQGSKGFHHLFYWNVKSCKKLFSSNSDLQERSKQKKECDGHLPITELQVLDGDDTGIGLSSKGSSDLSCSSSVVEEECHGNKAPGVVARLMGLDSLPNSNVLEPNSYPSFDSVSLCISNYKNLECHQESQIVHSNTLHEVPTWNGAEPKNGVKMNRNRPIRKFQTEVLCPKSAKSIPITPNKFLSPVKSVNLIPSEEAVHIMVTAAKIIEPGPYASTKTKLPLVGSSLVPLRVRNMKAKAQAAAPKQTIVSEGSKKPGVSIKNHREHSMNKSLKQSKDATSKRVFPDLEETSSGVKSKGKSISLALQAKANVQKREGLALTSSRSLVIQEETSEFAPIQLFKNHSTTDNITFQKQSIPNSTSVLRNNNQKQNGIVDSGKLPLSSKVQGVKAPGGGFSSTRQKNSSKLFVTSKVKPNKSCSEAKANKREVLASRFESAGHKKRSVHGSYPSEKGQDAGSSMRVHTDGKVIQSSAIVERHSNWDQGGAETGTDVISFTFNSPMTRLGPVSKILTENKDGILVSAEYNSQCTRTALNVDGLSASKFPFLGHNATNEGDESSTILEKKITELTDKVLLEETGKCSSNMSESREVLDCQILSPVSVLGHSSLAGSCDSSDSGDSSKCTEDSKQCSLIQAQETLSTDSLKMMDQTKGDSELLDSASSACSETVLKSRETVLTFKSCGKAAMSELKYIKDMLCNIELSFNDFTLGNVCEIINPCLFYQMESWTGQCDDHSVLFDCARECIELQCRQYAGGGWKSWSKGVSAISETERLAQDVYKEITRWRNMKDCDTDQVVDNDMSYQCGKWAEFEIEAFEMGVKIESGILGRLVDEVVADILVL